MASPPKPWERAGSAAAGASAMALPSLPSTSVAVTRGTTDLTPTTAPESSSTTPPAIPQRPASLTSPTATSTAVSRPYNTYGGYSTPYASPYSRLGTYGGYGTGMYGGYGGYGGMYGGMGGMGGMYGGMPGMGMDPNNPNSLTNQFSQSTQATFQLLEGLVGAFTGFAQMLESTYMTTHSSFFAMVAVAEQFSNLRNTLGNILGIFTLIRWLKTVFAKLTGRPPPVDATSLNPIAFAKFEGRNALISEGGGASSSAPKPSRKPLLFFLAAAFGLPYLMKKLIKSIASNQEQRQGQAMSAVMPSSSSSSSAAGATAFDPSKLEFCRVMWDFEPASQPAGSTAEGFDLPVKKGDLVAVLSKNDPLGNPSEWWRCRARNGKQGYVPSAYLEVVQRIPPGAAMTTGPADSPRIVAPTEIAEARKTPEKVEIPSAGKKPDIGGKMPPTPPPEKMTAEKAAKHQFFS